MDKESFDTALSKAIIDYQTKFGKDINYIFLSQDVFDELKKEMNSLEKFYIGIIGNSQYAYYRGYEIIIVKYKENFSFVA